MASIHDILTAETKTDHSVRLYREGSLFYRAYERSAYLFVHHVRDYQAVRKYYKGCNSFVVSIGFPQKSLPSLGCQYVVNADGTVSIPVEAEIDEQQFLQWKDNVPLHQKDITATPSPSVSHPTPTLKPDAKLDTTDAEVLRRLRQYNLAASTPMQAMLFVSELQRMLNDGKGTAV